MTTVLVTPAVVQFVVGPVTGNRYVPNGAGEITVDNADLALLQAVGFIIPTGGGAVTPPQVVGGIIVGSAGVSGIYVGHTLSWGDEFAGALDIVGPSAPKGKYFASKGYSAGPRGNPTQLGVTYDVDPLFTGHLDSNRGVPIGYSNLQQNASVLRLGARLATTVDQAGLPATDATLNGGVRAIISSMIHTEGALAFYPPNVSSVIVEASVRYVGNGQTGWHPDFWTNSGNPMNTFGTGVFDSLNSCEGNSVQGNTSDNLITNGVTAGQVVPSTPFSTLYDGNFHLVSMVLTSASNTWFVYIDGVLWFTLAASANQASKPQYVIFTSHVIAPTPLGFLWLTENFSQGAWNSTGAGMHIDYVRVWRPTAANHYKALATVPDLLVGYNGTGSITIPSTLSLWGDATVTEYVQCVPAEVNSPGLEGNPLAPAAAYSQFPPGISYNSGTRVLSADFSTLTGSAGVMHGVVKAWQINGSTCEPARFSIVRGPRLIAAGGNITVSSASSVDLYAATDVGIATPKTVTVTGLPTGMTYNAATGLATGTPTGAATPVVTTTNSFGQALVSNFTCINGSLQAETYAFMARMGNLGVLPSTTTRNALDTCIAAIKAQSGLWASIQAFVWFGLASSSGDAASCLLNIKGDFWNPLLVGTPTLTAYQGFLTNGTSNGINTTFNPFTYTLTNNLAFSVWSNTAGQTATGGLGNLGATTGFSTNIRNASDLFAYRSNDGTADTTANASGTGFFTNMRSAAGTKKAFKSGVQLGTTLTTASIAADNSSLGVGMIGSSNAQTSFSARQWGGYVIRTGNFADADELALYNAINTLNSAVGP